MDSRDFAFWLQEFFKVSDDEALDKKQLEIVKKHLALVFKDEIDSHLRQLSFSGMAPKVEDGMK
jgi:hypothetical protein